MTTIDGKRVRRGFDPIPCPKCGESNVAMLDLATLAEVHCESCDETMRIDDIRDMIGVWTRVLTWIDTAPAASE